MSNYDYYNINPNKHDENDCVCRAISLATELPYNSVKKLLTIVANYYECDELCVCCYKHLLSDVFDYPISYCYDGETIGEVALKHRNNVCIIRTVGHLAVSVNGTVRDTFDSTPLKADCFWIVA